MTNVVSIGDAAIVPPAPAGDDDGGDRRVGGGPPEAGLPADCPVTPLGMSEDGKFFYYLDAGQRLCLLRDKDHSRLGILALFNKRMPVLLDYWPRLSKVKDEKTGEVEWITTGWKPERAAEELMAACGREGTLRIQDAVRGTGAWIGPDRELILHCGDRVLIDNAWHKPGRLAGKMYPSYAPTPYPMAAFAPGGSRGPGQDALELFRSWCWARPEIDPYLLLGALGVAKIGGALRWRPTIWLTGDFGSGKSTLLEYFAGLLGEGGVHMTSDTTAAGIWQRTKQSSHPVLIDEAEAEPGSRRMSGLIGLARVACSGGYVYRGGSEHAAVQFQIKGSFVFSSIVIPGLPPQDRSRIAVLDLLSLVKVAPPAITPAKLKAMGEALTRRMIDGWSRFAEVLEQYRDAFIDEGHSGRSADQWATLLACADVMLHDHADATSDELRQWCDRLPPERDAARDHQNCVAHLMSTPIDPYRSGGRRTIAQWIEDALVAEPNQPRDANKALETYGLSVELQPSPAGTVRWLYVANTHQGLAQLFAGSHWAGSSGTSSPWVQALRRVPHSEPVRFRRFAGYGARATRLPLDPLLDDSEDAR